MKESLINGSSSKILLVSRGWKRRRKGPEDDARFWLAFRGQQVPGKVLLEEGGKNGLG